MQAYNKAIAGVLTPLIIQAILGLLIYAGVTITPEVNAALTSLITGAVVWAVPNIVKELQETIVEYTDEESAAGG